MVNILKGNVLLIGALLVGYCLAYPIKLAQYFFEKPAIDHSLYLLLFFVSFYLTNKFWSRTKALKYFAFVLLLLPLAWFKFDYWAYSQLSSPQFITYASIMVLGISARSLLKYPISSSTPDWTKLIAIPFMVVGFVLSFWSKQHNLSIFLVLYFALGLVAFFWREQKVLSVLGVSLAAIFVVSTSFYEAPKFFDSQSRYDDKVVLSVETDLQKIDVTEWKGNHWFYTDGINQFSSIDYWLFYEPFTYPVLELADKKERVLIIGGENGMLMHELERAKIREVDIIPVDIEYYKLAQNETLFRQYNWKRGGIDIHLKETEVFNFLSSVKQKYDLVFIDVADPIDLERNQYYTIEFYEQVEKSLNQNGFMITQSGSPYFATDAFEIVQRTIQSAGFNTFVYHNQVLTLGEWSWTIGAKGTTKAMLKEQLMGSEFSNYRTKWLNNDAMRMMMSFGKATRVVSNNEVNTMSNPILYKYYLNGNYTLR